MIHSPLQVIHNGSVANGSGVPVFVRDFENITLQIGSTGSGACTVKVQGAFTGKSSSTAGPNFNAPRTVSNHWDYCNTVDLQSLVVSPGDTGVVMAGTDSDNIRNIVVNCQDFDWINVEISNYTAGTVTVKAAAYSSN